MGYQADGPALDGVASKLRNAAGDLDGGAASPPPPVDADIVSEVANGLAAAFTLSLGGVVEGVGAMGDGVANSRSDYAGAEQTNTDALPR